MRKMWDHQRVCTFGAQSSQAIQMHYETELQLRLLVNSSTWCRCKSICVDGIEEYDEIEGEVASATLWASFEVMRGDKAVDEYSERFSVISFVPLPLVLLGFVFVLFVVLNNHALFLFVHSCREMCCCICCHSDVTNVVFFPSEVESALLCSSYECAFIQRCCLVFEYLICLCSLHLLRTFFSESSFVFCCVKDSFSFAFRVQRGLCVSVRV